MAQDKKLDTFLGYALTVLIAAALAGGLVEALRGGGDDSRAEGLLARGAAAPPFMAVRHADKKPVQLADLHGKVVLLDFWGTWCGPCRHEAPIVRDVARAYAGQEVAVLAMDDEQGAPNPEETVAAFMKQEQLEDYPVAYPDPAIFDRYQITVFPTLYVIGRDGTVRFRAKGNVTESRLRKEIDAALKG